MEEILLSRWMSVLVAVFFIPFIYFTSFSEQDKTNINSLRWSARRWDSNQRNACMWVACSTTVLQMPTPQFPVFYYLCQGDYIFGWVGLFFMSVCLSVSNITQKVMNELQWNFMEGSRVVKGTSVWLDFGSNPDHHADCPIGNPAIYQQIWTDSFFRRALQWYKEQFMKLLGWSRSPCWLSKSGIRAIWR